MTKAQTKQNEPTQTSINAGSLAAIVEAKRVKDKKQGELRTAYATASLRGLNVDAAKVAIKIVEQGRDAVDKHFEDQRAILEYVAQLGLVPSPSQYEMFNLKVGPTPEDERATIEGLACGFSLDPEMSEEKNPYDPGSSKGQAWLAAFRDGRSQRDLVMSMPVPQGKNEDDESED